jgi:hypothetical protein
LGLKVFFENGQVVFTVPDIGDSYYERRELINEADIIVSDGIEYDLTNRDSIYSIKIPEYVYQHKNKRAQELGVTGYLEYILRMHSGLLWAQKKYDLAIPCLAKATQLMLYSTIGWSRKDFYRIVNWNIALGRFKKAKEWKEWIERNTKSDKDIIEESFSDVLQSCASLKTDLVEVGDVRACCGICAKYRKRIYSLTGKNKRFPKFPKDFCGECGLHVSPFVYGVMEPSFDSKHYILYSWRPFRDDRTELEKQNHIDKLAMIEQMEKKERISKLNHIIYYFFQPKFSDIFPKTVSAFSRMRNANTDKYQKIVIAIEGAGYKIPESLEEAADLEEKQFL